MTGADDAVRSLRAQVRDWRRGRADTRLVDVVQDAYIGVFTVVMLGAMAVSVLVQVRVLTTESCSTPACLAARSWLPWLLVAATVAASMQVARTVGPVFVTPAVASWLLPTPLERAALLRTRLAVALGGAALAGGLTAAAAAVTAGLDREGGSAAALVGAAACLGAVALCAVGQLRLTRLVPAVAGALAVLVWVALVLLAVDRVPDPTVDPAYARGWWAAPAVVALGAAASGVAAFRALPRLGRAQLAPAGAVVPSLSGALATLDLALLYDVLLARRWRLRSRVRAVRSGWSGVGALVHRDLVRLRRSPRPVLVLAAALVVPYLSSRIGLARPTLLLTAATAFLAMLGLLPGLRVLSRTPGLVRCFPHPAWAVRGAGLVVPAGLAGLWGLATVPALRGALAVPWDTAVVLGVVTALVGLTAAAWWMTGNPPDYRMPLISSPAGAVPPGLMLAVARGPDVLLVAAAPMLFSPTPLGAAVALALALGTVAWFLLRR